MLFRGTIAADYSGALNGVVASRNRGITYMRNRGPIPALWTPSANQLNIQSAMAGCNVQWQSMSSANRDGWEAWAQGELRKNAIGARHTRTGFNEFVRWCHPRRYSNLLLGTSLTTPDDPPARGQTWLSMPPTIVLRNGDPRADIYFDTTDEWSHLDDSGLLIFTSRLIPPTRNRPYGGFTLLWLIPGSVGTPPTSPVTIILPFSPNTNDRVYIRCRATTPYYSMSHETTTRGVSP